MITNVIIKNFRSIESVEIACGQITTFVGRNDAGKSNILRALNLFFNNETDPGFAFSFSRDFNQFTSVPAKKAPEIMIELHISLPFTYIRDEYPSEICWKKVWRYEGLHSEVETYTNGVAFPPRSRIHAWMSKIIFEYVPAIKDKDFFVELQGKVYDVLASVAETDLRASAATFEQHIQSHLENLAIDVSTVFHNASLVKLPENLRHIFEKLEFNSMGIPLSRRGDGIKVRHIPMILKFMADKRNSLANSIKHMHVWGIEEPENNVEMVSCFEMADQFAGYTEQGLQVFISTHSPVFYSQRYGAGISDVKYRVSKDESASDVYPIALDTIDKDMGLMPIVAPHILREKKKWEEDLSMLRVHQSELEALLRNEVPCLFCEGKSDELVLRKALQIYYPDTDGKIMITSGQDGAYGSAAAAASRLIAWQLIQKHSRKPVRAAALFDFDTAGKKAKSEVVAYVSGRHNSHIKAYHVRQSELVKGMIRKGYSPRVDLEMLYSDTMWDLAKNKNWISPIEDFGDAITSKKICETHSSGGALFYDLSASEKNRLLHTFTDKGKEQASKNISAMVENEAIEHVQSLKPTLQEILRYLLPEATLA